ncbi:uncharacterized protein LOC142893118 [Nelusetta ayraudi]|uniref:uncharacterized protein LOC142893118 n=1 Tax=Nelusetta ayraudi TaxID=303726 RepID=UPI003F6EEC51
MLMKTLAYGGAEKEENFFHTLLSVVQSLLSAATMHSFGILVVFLSLSTACGLRCYSCTVANPRSCTDINECAYGLNRCYSIKVEAGGYEMVSKGCQSSATCLSSMGCCEGNLCNSARMPTGSSLVLLLVSSAITLLFLSLERRLGYKWEGFALVDSILPVPAQTFDLSILTMKLFGVLVLMATVLTEYTKCMICLSLVLLRHVKGVMTKNCALSSTCSSLVDCCSGDLCNGAITTGSSVLLMLVTSAIFTVFL